MLIRNVHLANIHRVQPDTPEHPPNNGPFPTQEDGSPGPPIDPPIYNAYAFSFDAKDPSKLQYGTAPPLIHIVAPIGETTIEFDVEYEIEIRPKKNLG